MRTVNEVAHELVIILMPWNAKKVIFSGRPLVSVTSMALASVSHHERVRNRRMMIPLRKDQSTGNGRRLGPLLSVMTAGITALIAVVTWTIPGYRVIAAIFLGLSIGFIGLLISSRGSGGGTVHAPPRPSTPGPESGFVTPSQLPPPPDLLLGRDEYAEMLRQAVRRRRGGRPGVIVVRGEAGIGKTALVVQFAYLVANDFPDGRLFGSAAKSAGDTQRLLSAFVEALHDHSTGVPPPKTDLAARYAAMTHNKRVLIILDDVEDAASIRALLPASSGSVVVVTSRRSLPDLETDLDVELPRLSKDASKEVLRHTIGAERAAAAVAMIDRIDDDHPLSLRLAGLSLNRLPRQNFGRLLARVSDEWDTSGVGRGRSRTAMDLTYALLAAEERRALKLLGLLREDELAFAPWMLAALAGATEDDAAWRVTERLVEARLVRRVNTDASGVAAFRLLETVHRYARSRLMAEASESDRRVRREALDRARAARTSHSAGSDLHHEVYGLKDRGEMNRAMDVTLAALSLARENGDRASEALALGTLAELNAELGYIVEATNLAEKALSFHDPNGSVRALRSKALARRREFSLDETVRYFDRALALLDTVSDGPGASQVTAERVRVLCGRAVARGLRADQPSPGLADLEVAETLLTTHAVLAEEMRPGLCWARGVILDRFDKHSEALRVLREGQRLADALGQRWWSAWLACAAARVYDEMGDIDRFRTAAGRAVDLFAAMQAGYGIAHSRYLLGKADRLASRIDTASASLEEGLEALRFSGDRHLEAHTLMELGHVRLAQGRTAQAKATAQQARRIFADLKDDEGLLMVGSLLDNVRAVERADQGTTNLASTA